MELTFGHDLAGNPACGFNLGSKAEDVVLPLEDAVNVGEVGVRLSQLLLDFVVKSGLPIFDRVANEGCWKFVLIRTTELDESMVAICTYGPLPEAVLQDLAGTFGPLVTSLYAVDSLALEGWGASPNVRHLAGRESITERLRGLLFEISPMSFFQTNTAGAELLLQKIEELAGVDENTVLVDCCCGTGVIGLSIAGRVKEVIGIDIEEAAIIDARNNAERNGVENATFIAGKAEAVMFDVLSKYQSGEKIVCIVDPPRGGLHKKALKAVRECSLIRRLVFVACEPDSFVQNATNHLMNASGRSQPFHPVSWFGVDMFPHTDRIELVVLLER
jgi:tRNA (uracil-5-)-methyltransferase